MEKEVVQLRMIERELSAYQGQIELLASSIQVHRKALETLEAVPDLAEGDEVLIPIGGGVILKTAWSAGTRVLIDVGAGVVVEDDVTPAVDNVTGRLRQMEASVTKLDSHLNDLKAQYAMLSQKVQQAYQGTEDVQEPAG
jgi:prefoldin alpha subunit